MLLSLLFESPISFFMIVAAIMFAFTVHEYSHAQAAYSLGDNTPKYKGRLTINPLAHLDPFGTILIFIAGFGWGKPVPFNPYNLKNQRWGPAIVALAGPASNFFMFFASGFVLRFLNVHNEGLVSFLFIFAWLNLLLGFFNMLPFPPLDGSHIFSAIFPSFERKIKGFGANSFLLILAAIFLMMYVIIPFILPPIFKLVTGMSIGG